uniref:Uncharacterized protein n=1 Tax=Ciona intestinalis TaxID=7719 RepID=H2XXF1_CIOIN
MPRRPLHFSLMYKEHPIINTPQSSRTEYINASPYWYKHYHERLCENPFRLSSH